MAHGENESPWYARLVLAVEATDSAGEHERGVTVGHRRGAVMAAEQRGSFRAKLDRAAAESGGWLCVGLDPDLGRLPRHLRGVDDGAAIVAFNAAIVDATRDLVCAFKPNLGFYLALGSAGIEALAATRRLVPPEIPAILDAKIADIGVTSAAYASGVFDQLGFDAVTVNPYLGEAALAPFLARPDRGLFVLCKTSNPGSGDLQDLPVAEVGGEPRPLYAAVAERVAGWSERAAASVGLVVGATYPAELGAVRERCPGLPILLPGVGAQAGDVGAAVAAGLDETGGGLIVTSSRAVLYAGDGVDFGERARQAATALRDEINVARRAAATTGRR